MGTCPWVRIKNKGKIMSNLPFNLIISYLFSIYPIIMIVKLILIGFYLTQNIILTV